MIYGNVIILLLGSWYAMCVSEALGLRDHICEDQRTLSEGEPRLLGVERFLLRAPFSLTSDSPAKEPNSVARAVQTLGILFGPVVAAASYLTMLVEYFQCELPGYAGNQVRVATDRNRAFRRICADRRGIAIPAGSMPLDLPAILHLVLHTGRRTRWLVWLGGVTLKSVHRASVGVSWISKGFRPRHRRDDRPEQIRQIDFVALAPHSTACTAQ